MDIDSRRINSILGNISASLGKEEKKIINELNEEQQGWEYSLTQENICPSRYKGFYANSDIEELESLEKNEPFSPSVSKALSCFVESIIPNTNEGLMKYMMKVWTKDPKLIGSPSAEGYVYAEVVGGAQGLIAIKVPQRPEYDQLSHEYVIGKYALNPLRSECPHFLYILGKFLCNPPIIGDEKKLIGICSENSSPSNLVTYLILENLNPSTSIGDYVVSLPDDQEGLMFLCSSLYQVLRALRIGINRCGFVHNDLHSGNVLMREIKDPQFPSYLKYSDGYLLTDGSIATIIDFGRTRAILDVGEEDANVGPYLPFLIELGIEPNSMNEFYDIYKLLCFLLLDMKERTDTLLYDRLARLFRFFNKREPIPSVLKNQWDSRFAFPLMPEVTLGLEDFIEHFESVFSDIIPLIFSTSMPEGTILSCEDYQCLTPKGIQDHIERDQRPIKTLDEFMLYVGSMYQQNPDVTSIDVKKKIDSIGFNITPGNISQLMTSGIKDMYSTMSMSLYPVSINTMKVSMLSKPDVARDYEKSLSILRNALDKDDKLHKTMISLKILFIVYPELMTPLWNEYVKVFKKHEHKIKKAIKALMEDVKLLKTDVPAKEIGKLYPTALNMSNSLA